MRQYNISPISDNVIAAVLAEKVKCYFSDKEHRAAFEEWYRNKYGKEYKWKTE